jgi:hypothetical protein
MGYESDTQFELHEITEVDANPDGSGWSVSFGGFGIWVTSKNCSIPPRVGEAVQLFGAGFGYAVRGIIVSGRVYRYASQEDWDKQIAAEVVKQAREREEQAQRERSDRDARIERLPEPLRLRMWRFHKVKPNFASTTEPYELFVCEEAAKIASHCCNVEMLKVFHELEHEEQMKIVSVDHSGNTFAQAMRLAHLLLERPELAPYAHAATCPLGGCTESGCWAGHEGKNGAVLPSPEIEQ